MWDIMWDIKDFVHCQWFKTLVWNVWSNQRSIKKLILYLDTLVTLSISKFGDSFGQLLTAIWIKIMGCK